MSKYAFFKAFFEALEDEIRYIDFPKISPIYEAKRKQINSIMKTLECLPETIQTENGVVNVPELLKDLGEYYEHLFGIGFDIAIKRGFSLAFKLIFHNLTMDPGECIAHKGQKTEL